MRPFWLTGWLFLLFTSVAGAHVGNCIGSYVFALPVTLFTLTAAFGAVMAFLHSAFIHPCESAGKSAADPTTRKNK